MQSTSQCHKECLILDRQISTPVVVNSFVEDSEIKTCEHEISLLQRRNDSLLAELNAHVCSIIAVEHKVSSLDELYMQEINSVVSPPIDNMPLVENVVNFGVEG